MGNEWIEFVRQYAKENKVSYTQALKKAGPVYRQMKNSMVGKGLSELPESVQKEIGSALDVKSLAKLNTTNRGMHEANTREFEDRPEAIDRREAMREAMQYSHLMRSLNSLSVSGMSTGRSLPPDYYDSVQSHLDILRRLVNNPVLSDDKRENVQRAINRLTDKLRRRM